MIHHYIMLRTFLFLIILSSLVQLSAAPVRNNVPDQGNAAIAQMRSSFESMRHDLNNHEVEIRVFEEKLLNLDAIIDAIRDQLNDTNKWHKEQLKGSSANLESKITTLDALSKNLVSDLKQFKTYSNETSTTLSQYKQRIGDLEKVVEQQSQNIDHLQAAMQTLMEAILVKDTSTAKINPDKVNSEKGTVSGNSYRIKAGDSLEKIARANQTTVQAIKDLNGLVNDKIVVGQLIHLPEK